MNVLDDLIRIKSGSQEDDLLKLLDEIPVYEKLSIDEKLSNLSTSEITRKKCPLLAAFTDGKLYETILADLAANVYLQIEGNIPPVLRVEAERTGKQKKQFEILQAGITHVEYRDLILYDPETMSDLLTAVFVKKHNGTNTAALIVKTTGGYIMYHGIYIADEKGKDVQTVNGPINVKGKNGFFSMPTYSVLGNNGYPFAQYNTDTTAYDIMIGPKGTLYLIDKRKTILTYEIPTDDKNTLNMAKHDAVQFAKELTTIIERVVRT